jgi:hypothetical protein
MDFSPLVGLIQAEAGSGVKAASYCAREMLSIRINSKGTENTTVNNNNCLATTDAH